MTFWDSSGILPLIVKEEDTESRKSSLQLDPDVAVWWASKVECASALNRLARDGELDGGGLLAAFRDLEQLAASWVEVQPVEEVRSRAVRLLRIHPLRAADALQLAAALIVVHEDPRTIEFVTADERLKEAAEKEGFTVR